MKLTIFGTGYVGLVTGACFADVGHKVLCVDIDPRRIESLEKGEVPFFEPGLKEMVLANRKAGRLAFTTDGASAVRTGDIIFIAVGTPSNEDGSANLSHVRAVARTIGENIDGYKIVVGKSTVPVGTADMVRSVIEQAQAKAGTDHPFDVCSNPEFLKEGSAIEDFARPARVIIGTDSRKVRKTLAACYAPYNRNHDKLMMMDIRSAELTKYAANAMLATKISFMNEMAAIAEPLGADIENVRRGIGSDPRIGYQFLFPGTGYGGSCFPKDVKALMHTAEVNHHPLRLLQAVDAVNRDQKGILLRKVAAHFGGELAGRRFAVWGLAFKPNTDDMRYAPAIDLVEGLLAAGASVVAHDPQAMENAAAHFGDRITLSTDHYACLDGADALCICTEWNVFRRPDFDQVARRLKAPVLFDGRNLYDPERMAARGFTYYAIGRGRSLPV